MLKKLEYSILLAFLFCSGRAFSQSGTDWLENTMFQSGKINVVVAVVGVLIIILFIYLFSLDRKLKKIEEEEKN